IFMAKPPDSWFQKPPYEVDQRCMQVQSSASAWLDEADRADRAISGEDTPALGDVLSGIEERPRPAADPAEADADALGAYLREIGDQARTIRVRLHIGEQTYKLIRVSDRLRDSLGRQATDEEISEELGLTPVEVVALRRTSRDTVSLETPIGEEGDTELGHLI